MGASLNSGAALKFAVLDFETTGVSNADRVIEIGVVVIDIMPRVRKRWRTLVQPNRGFDNTEIHHLRPVDLLGAPTFAQVARRFAAVLDGCVLVAHNASFEQRFLANEFARVGVTIPPQGNAESDAAEPGLAPGFDTQHVHGSAFGEAATTGIWYLDTMQLARERLRLSSYTLPECLSAVGLSNPAAHTALADAESTALLLAKLHELQLLDVAKLSPLHFDRQEARRLPIGRIPLLARADGLYPDAVSDNVSPDVDPFCVDSTGPAESMSSARSGNLGLGGKSSFPSEMEAPNEAAEQQKWLRRRIRAVPDTGDEASDKYYAFLAKAMIDGTLNDLEKSQLAWAADQLGLTHNDVAELREHYLKQLVIEAWSDGVLTDVEQSWLLKIAEELSVDREVLQKMMVRRNAGPAVVLEIGDRVTFTGAMINPREEWERRAQAAGLSVGGVTRKSKLVVAADLATYSGKAKKAREYGVPIVTEAEFAELLAAVEQPVGSAHGQHSATTQQECHPQPHISNSALASREVLSQLFPWLPNVESQRLDTIGIAQTWLINHRAEPLLSMSDVLTVDTKPSGVEWLSRTGAAWETRFPQPLAASAMDLLDIPGVGRVRLQSMISAVIVEALDCAENFVEPSASCDSDILLDWFALTGQLSSTEAEVEGAASESVGGAGALAEQSISVSTVGRRLPNSVRQAMAQWDERADEVCARAAAEIAALVQRNPEFSYLIDEGLVRRRPKPALAEGLGTSEKRIRQRESQLREKLTELTGAAELVTYAIAVRFAPHVLLDAAVDALPGLLAPIEGLDSTLLDVLAHRSDADWVIRGHRIVVDSCEESEDDVVADISFGVSPVLDNAEVLEIGLSAAPEDSDGLYFRDGNWQLLTTITADFRGGAIEVPKAVATIYGLGPSQHIDLPSMFGTVRVSNFSGAVKIGNIWRFVDKSELREGDRVWLKFGKKFDVLRATNFTVVEGNPLLGAEMTAKAALNLIGFDDRVGENRLTDMFALELLNNALGLSPDVARRRTVARLQNRGLESLASWAKGL